MQAAMMDSVLIEQVVLLASKAREATGQDPIFDIPKGTSKENNCPIQRALNRNCTVSGSWATFRDEGHAKKVAEALGLPCFGARVTFPHNHPFRVFVQRFDGRLSKRMEQLRITP